jgi:hypothetical protein
LSRRVFVTVTRGMTDKTAVCVFPWEIDVLALVHGQEIKEVSLDEMCSMQGAVKVEKQKLKKLPELNQTYGPDLRAQLQAMCYVDPDEDPCKDPAAEYSRLAEKYGMDKDVPFPCVTRVYGEFSSGAFTAKLKEHADDSAEKPEHMGAGDEPNPADMSREQLRAALTSRGIKWKATEGRDALAAKLEEALAPA